MLPPLGVDIRSGSAGNVVGRGWGRGNPGRMTNEKIRNPKSEIRIHRAPRPVMLPPLGIDIRSGSAGNVVGRGARAAAAGLALLRLPLDFANGRARITGTHPLIRWCPAGLGGTASVRSFP